MPTQVGVHSGPLALVQAQIGITTWTAKAHPPMILGSGLRDIHHKE